MNRTILFAMALAAACSFSSCKTVQDEAAAAKAKIQSLYASSTPAQREAVMVAVEADTLAVIRDILDHKPTSDVISGNALKVLQQISDTAEASDNGTVAKISQVGQAVLKSVLTDSKAKTSTSVKLGDAALAAISSVATAKPVPPVPPTATP